MDPIRLMNSKNLVSWNRSSSSSIEPLQRLTYLRSISQLLRLATLSLDSIFLSEEIMARSRLSLAIGILFLFIKL
jgi:hypothetical protein